MAIDKQSIKDREFNKFADTAGGETAVRVISEDFKIENPNISVELDAAEDSVECIQDTHDDLNVNANMQIGDVDVGAGNPLPVSLTPAAVTPTITNLSLVTVNTEVDHTLQANLQKLLIKNRNNGKLQFAFTDTDSGTNFITIPAGATYTADDINFTAGTLSIQSNKANQTVEILEWA